MMAPAVRDLLAHGAARGVRSVRVGPGNGKTAVAKQGPGVLVGWDGTRPGVLAFFRAYDGVDAQGRLLVHGYTFDAGAPGLNIVFRQGLFVQNLSRDESVIVFFV